MSTLLLFELGPGRPPEDEPASPPPVFAIDVAHVLQVMEADGIAAVPLAPVVIEGVLNHHGRIVTIVDPAPLLNLPPQPQPVVQVVILRRPSGSGGQIGLKVAHTREILATPQLAETDVPAGPGVEQVLRQESRLVHVISYDALLTELSRCFELPANERPSAEAQGVSP